MRLAVLLAASLACVGIGFAKSAALSAQGNADATENDFHFLPMAQDNKKRDQNSKNGKRDHAAGPDVTPEHILAGTLKGCL